MTPTTEAAETEERRYTVLRGVREGWTGFLVTKRLGLRTNSILLAFPDGQERWINERDCIRVDVARAEQIARAEQEAPTP